MAGQKGGLVTGEKVQEVFAIAKEHEFALPAVNIVSSNTLNAAMETAREVNSPIIIQQSSSGAQFYAGKTIPNDQMQASVSGSVVAAYHVNRLAEQYGVYVILHTDHCSKSKLAWVEGLVKENEKYYAQYGNPLYSSHMLDFSAEPLEDNLAMSTKVFERMAKMGMTLEIELGVTGGEEDGVDNTGVDSSRLYTQPEDVALAYEKMSAISNRFTIAAAFGNVHGVYKPGNVKLQPIILKNCQDYIVKKFGTGPKPASFVFHGGSGSSREEIREAISYGVIKMNIDTDTQWAFTQGMTAYYKKFEGYLQTQIGNPEGDDLPNKKYYDPRKWLRSCEEVFVSRLKEAFEDLNCIDRAPLLD